TVEDLARLPDISEGLENRIYAALRTATSMEALLEAVKTKRYSRARLRRILLCAWLGVTSEMSAGEPPYIHILGMNRRGQEILAQVGQGVSLPLSHSLMRLSQTGERAKAFAQLESTADDLYATGTNLVQPCGKDYTNGIIKL
ncbi:MAG: nucleotidyltransferase family protein, partial [Angelakisella sp.]